MAPVRAAAVGKLGPFLWTRRSVPSDQHWYAGSLRAARAALHLVPPASNTASAPIFPPGVPGKIFEWLPAAGAYVATTTGGPANGARIILYYPLNPNTGLPAIDPTSGLPTEIGYLDLMDESDPSATKLHIHVVGTAGAPITYLDYSVSGTFTTTSRSAVVVGFITDGAHRLDFNSTASETDTTFSADIRFDANAENVHVELKHGETVTTSSFDVTTDFSFQRVNEAVTVTGSESIDRATFAHSGTFTVTVNGAKFATVTVTPSGVTYVGARGPLTPDENTFLDALGRAAVRSDVLARFGDLFFPIDNIIP